MTLAYGSLERAAFVHAARRLHGLRSATHASGFRLESRPRGGTRSSAALTGPATRRFQVAVAVATANAFPLPTRPKSHKLDSDRRRPVGEPA